MNKELFELIKSQYPDYYQSIFDSFFGKTATYLRVNTLKADANTIALRIGGTVLSQKTIECPSANKAILEIESGDFYIQGLASQKAVELLDAKPDMTVIDVCA